MRKGDVDRLEAMLDGGWPTSQGGKWVAGPTMKRRNSTMPEGHPKGTSSWCGSGSYPELGENLRKPYEACCVISCLYYSKRLSA
ncbi:hypothetical protein CTI12_AA120170 [Artemisia annua]|uniref:Uncharacterized protein n=1 Tax=Artemisia annua TaxID=35608 RepID=A0A2U1PRY4_ARTAN|nr:hypothetical protein CTI12_AA120170 [Artemisia annua]